MSTDAFVTTTTWPWLQTFCLDRALTPLEGFPAPIDRAVVESAVSRLHRKRAPGEDRTGAAALQHAPRVSSPILQAVQCLRIHYFPSLLKHSKIVTTPKLSKMHMIPENIAPCHPWQ